jgi:hypothetical protein
MIRQLEEQGVTQNEVDRAVQDYFGANPVTAQSIGAAPAGYGLGTFATGASDLNTALQTGWYLFGEGSENHPAHMNYGVVNALNRNSVEFAQIAYGVGNASFADGLKAQRFTNDCGATWSEWEYVNPPMYPGVEYRTTKRRNGKAVYTKLVNVGALPNATVETITVGVDGSKIVSVDGVAYPGNGYVSFTGSSLVIGGSIAAYYAVDAGGRMYLTANQDLSSYTADFTFEYTKD